MLVGFLAWPGYPWQEIWRKADLAVITRTLIMHVLGRDNCEVVAYCAVLVGVYVEELLYDAVKNR